MQFLCCLSKAISRILCYVIICLFQIGKSCFAGISRDHLALLLESSELLLTESRDVFNPIFCFVLAPNKDLAVSVLHYCRNIPIRYARRFHRGRFCSHLAHYCGRLLAAIFLSLTYVQDGVRTFLSLGTSKEAITHLAKTSL